MPTKQDWNDLTHKERMRLLAEASPVELAKAYQYPGLTEDAFRESLQKEIQLWDPQNIRDVQVVTDALPNKDIILGAWRDLDRAEAIMELIDNSIDAWHARKRDHAKKCHKQLIIAIDIDPKKGHLIYEDNAGGVPCKLLANLVVPGFSETKDLSRTIGSYRTGGKKAVFRLASAARILTRYWDPNEKEDEAIAVQLDRAWIEDTKEYAFPYVHLTDQSDIEKGSTRYVLQLRDEDVGPEPWYVSPANLGKVIRQITNAYTLLMIRNPSIKIRFRKKPIKPNRELYDFTGTKRGSTDIRPQQIIFEGEMEFKGKRHPIEVELVIGCRVTTGVKDGKAGGIDLYGNDRLFVSYDQEIFSDLLPRGNSRNLVRGFINIKGPNIFIPWDTHKRHLNADREIVRFLTKSKLIMGVFVNWRRVYRAVSRLGTGEVIAFIKTPIKPPIELRKRDLNLPHRSTVKIVFGANREVSLPDTVFVPVMPVPTKEHHAFKSTLVFTTDEARGVMTYYGKSGEPTKEFMKEIADFIKEELMEWVSGEQHR